MKLTTILLLTACLQLSAAGYGQRISISGQNMSLQKVFAEIQRQSGYAFLYIENDLGNAKKVNLNTRNSDLMQVLDQVFQDQPLTFNIIEKTIVVKEKVIPKAEPSSLPPPIDVRGRVVNEAGEPVTATVTVKGTKQAVATNEKGEFILKGINENATLVFSGVTIETDEVNVAGRSDLSAIQMKTKVTAMAPTVVVGYGTQRRQDVTGAISTVPKDRLSQMPVPNVLQAIQGSVAGVNITPASSAPNSTQNIYIRGLNSISASTTPLFVIDGIPFSGSLYDINPGDIENITILKDASSTAIYGTRGSNGVVLITTKRGKTGKPIVNYNAYTGPEIQVNSLHPYSGELYAKKNLDYGKQNGLTTPAPYYNFTEKDLYDKNMPVDWMDLISRRGSITSNEVNVSGGSNSVKYYVAANYTTQKGALKGYKFDRLTLRSNLDITITDWFKIGTNLAYTNKNSDGGRVNFYLATQMSPFGNPYTDDGSYNIYPMNPEQLFKNPLLGLNNPVQRRVNDFNGNVYAEVNPSFLGGVKYRVNAGYNYVPSITRSYTGRNVGDLRGSASVSDGEVKSWIVENILTYNKKFGNHNIDVTALYSAQESSEFNNGLDANTFINDNLAFYNVGSGGVQQVSSSYTQSDLLSQMLRINYNYNQKYLLTLTGRRDGASVFGSSNKYAVFPSVALGWNLSNERFMENIRAINSLKLRLSYGVTGNQAVGPYRTLTTLGVQQYIYNGVTAVGVVPARLGNDNLKWEKTSGFNSGIDFSILKNRISGTVEFYLSKTSDLLLNRQIPTTSGYESVLDNIGSTSNKGIEFNLNTKNIQAGKFQWESGITFSSNRNKITALYGDDKDDITNKWFIGKPLRAVYDYTMDGIFQEGDDIAKSAQPNAKPGDIRFKDLNGDKVIDAKDRSYLGTKLPKYIFGLTNTFRYKNLSLSVFINAVQGSLRNNGFLDNWTMAGRTNLLSEPGYWTPENKSTTRPRLTFLNSYEYLYPNDNSFVRIQDVRLSYRFPNALLDRAKLSNLTIYVSGRNIYTFTKWVGYNPETDPENGIGGTNVSNPDNGYPNIATYVLGLNLGF